MFESLTRKEKGRHGRRWLVFVLGSAAVNLVAVTAAYFLIPRDPIVAPTEVAVQWAPRAEVASEEPPLAVESEPPPPPPVAQTSAQAAPAAGGGGRVRGLLEAPTAIPTAPPAMEDPVRPAGWETATGSGPTGGGTPVAESAGTPEAPTASVRKVLQVNEQMTPPVPDPSNPLPVYPEDARRSGRESIVEIRVVVDEEGGTTVAEVRRGEAPFLPAALEVLPRWRFRPALLDGAPVAVSRVIRIPFRLQR